MIQQLTQSMELKNWGVSLEQKSQGFKTKVLPAPTMQDATSESVSCTSQKLKFSKVLEGSAIQKWICVYAARDFNTVEQMLYGFDKAKN